MRPPIHLLCIDMEARTIARYRKRPGLWAVEFLARAVLPDESWPQLGSMPVWRLLENFRLHGRAE